MQWDDIGYLISKNRYNENSIIAEFYTENHGKITGLNLPELKCQHHKMARRLQTM